MQTSYKSIDSEDVWVCVCAESTAPCGLVAVCDSCLDQVLPVTHTVRHVYACCTCTAHAFALTWVQ